VVRLIRIHSGKSSSPDAFVSVKYRQPLVLDRRRWPRIQADVFAHHDALYHGRHRNKREPAGADDSRAL